MLSNDDFRQFLKRPRAQKSRLRRISRPPLTSRSNAAFRPTLTRSSTRRRLRSLARATADPEALSSLRRAPALADVPPKLRSAVFAITSEVLKQLAPLRRALADAAFSVDDDLSTDGYRRGAWRNRRVVGDARPAARLGWSARVAVVLLHDLLVSRRWLDRRQEAVRRLLSQQDRLRAAFESAAAAPAPAAYLTFYLVNTLRRSVDAVVDALKADGWTELSPLGASAKTSAVAAPRPADAPPPFAATRSSMACSPSRPRFASCGASWWPTALLPMDRASAAAARARAAARLRGNRCVRGAGQEDVEAVRADAQRGRTACLRRRRRARTRSRSPLGAPRRYLRGQLRRRTPRRLSRGRPDAAALGERRVHSTRPEL